MGWKLKKIAMGIAFAMMVALAEPSLSHAVLCEGSDLFATLSDEQHSALRKAEAEVPFARGLIWNAQKGDAQMLIVGTYHLDDPRHDALEARLLPDLEDAGALLVEAGPEEMAQLEESLTRDPSLLIDPEGKPLSERLDAETWEALASAMAERGIPALMTARMRPWYISVMLAMSPCVVDAMKADGSTAPPDGLDQRLIIQAEAMDLPIRALEPWDTMFTMFADLTPKDEVDMLRAALPMAMQADDYNWTVAEAYFEGRAWAIWLLTEYMMDDLDEMMPEVTARQIDLVQDKVLNARNHSWIAPMVQAAQDAAAHGKKIVVAVGLLHLAGDEGILNLLQDAGWTIAPAT